MKKLFKQLAMIFALMMPILGVANTATVDGITWTYTVANGSASLGGGSSYSPAVPKSTAGCLVIPSKLGGYPVTSIGNYAFYGCTKLASVTIPDSIRSIGNRAFGNCSGLTSVHITDIAKWCAITFGDSSANPLCYAGNLFVNDLVVTDLTIPDNVTAIGPYAFYGCKWLTSVIIPDSVISIGTSAFRSCSGLTSVTIPDSVTSIDWHVFYNCSSITNIIIPDSVTCVGGSAFCGCSGLASVIIPDSVTNIGYSAFGNCSGLTDVVIPDSVKTIEDYAFYGCSSLTNITMCDSVTSIGENAFSAYLFLPIETRIDISDLSAWCTNSVNRSIVGRKRLFVQGDEIEELVVPNGVMSIGTDAFSRCSGLTSVVMPDSVTNIGENAFGNCIGLTSVTIPDSVTSIGVGAFEYCSSLTSVTIPSRWKLSSVFYNSYEQITNVTIPYGSVSIVEEAFCNCRSLSSVTIPDSVTSIGDSAFYYCSSLTSVTIPSRWTLCSIFPYSYEQITDVTIPYGSVSIVGSAFAGCRCLMRVTMPGSVTSIGFGAFYDCGSLVSITLPASVTSIGSYAFYNCNGLTGVFITDVAAWCGISFEYTSANPLSTAHKLYLNGTLVTNLVVPDGVTSIGDYAFYGCSGIRSATIPDSVTKIGKDAFSGCDSAIYDTMTIKGVKLVDGWAVGTTGALFGDLDLSGIRGVGGSSFRNRSGLTSVAIPGGVTSIGAQAFSGCSGIKTVTMPDSVMSVEESAFYGCSGLTNVIMSSNVTSIGESAFYGCSGLTSVVIPSGVTNIGSSAFCNCSELASVMIPDSVSSVGSDAFYDTPFYNNKPNGLVVLGSVAYKMKGMCPADVVIPNGITSVGEYAFCGCSELTSIVIPDSVTSIGKSAFSGCARLISVTIPDGVTRIEDSLFGDCSGLMSVTIPCNVISIGNSVFYGCIGLTNVTIPNKVTSIGAQAFYSCSGLTSVTIPGSVMSLGSSVFSGCRGLVSVYLPKNLSDSTSGIPSSANIIRYSPRQKVTLDAKGIVPDMSIEVEYDSTYKALPEPFHVGYTFDGWTLNGEFVYDDTEVTALDDHTLVAQWTPNRYTVTFDANGGLDGVVVEQDYGTAISIPTVTREGYTFIGWLPDVSATVPASNVTYMAQWEINRYVVNFNANGGEGGREVEFEHGESLVAPEVSLRNYDLVGWYTSSCDGASVPEGVAVTNGMTLYAHWELKSNTWLYDVVDGNAVLTKYSSPDSAVFIPAEIDGFPVTSIAASIFYNCTNLTSVIIPDGVTNIATTAFSGCNTLTSIIVGEDNANYSSANGLLLTKDGKSLIRGVNGDVLIPSSVTSIRALAFCDCGGLTNVTIPDSVVSIGIRAFSGCSGLKSVTIPNSVTSIGNEAFAGCSCLTSVAIPDSVTTIGTSAFISCDGLLYDMTTVPGVKLVDGWAVELVGWPSDLSGTLNLTTVRGIVEMLFENCLGITSVIMGTGIKSIPDRAFACSGLKSVIIPNSVTSIGSGAFGSCGGLANVTIPTGVTSIGSGSFQLCSGLTSVTIPASVTNVGSLAFAWCSGLTRVTIGNGVTSIGCNAFLGCSDSLFDVATIPGVRLLDGWVVGYTGSLAGVLDLTGVRGIAEEAFRWCSGLTGVSMPDRIASIGNLAFKDCSSLSSVVFYGNVPSGVLESEILSNANSVYYPRKYASSYEQIVPSSQFGGYLLMGADEILNIYGWNILQDAEKPWMEDYDVTHDGEGSMRSGRIANDESTWIETTVNGPGRLSFWWKASSEEYDGEVFDYAYLSVDGVPQGTLDNYRLNGVAIGGKTDWVNVNFDIVDGGQHTIRWTYCKDEMDESDVGEDCAWLDEVSFVPYVSLTFDLAEGVGIVPDAKFLAMGSTLSLPKSEGFSRSKYRFVGWSDGAKIYDAGDEYVVTDKNVAFTAVWEAKTLSAPTISSADVENGGTHEAAYALISMTAENGASIYYTVDGTEPTTNGILYVAPIMALGMTERIQAIAVRDDYFDSAISEFAFSRKPYSAEECLNVAGLTVSTGGGDTAWSRVLGMAAHDGVAAMRSGAIGDGESSSIEMTVVGAGEIGFWWKSSSEISRNRKFDYVSFLIDGDEQSWMGGELDWTNEVFAVTGSGAHTFKWVYQKNGNGKTQGEDCAWLDEVVWTPSGPVIEGDDGADVTGDKESGYTVRPSNGKKDVVVTIPEGVEPEKVTVEVAATVETVKANGAKVKVMNEGHDIAEFLDLAAVTSAGGVINLAEAKVKDEVAKEALDTASGADIKLSPTDPSITTANTRPGLKYTFVEGRTIEELAPTEQYKWGDNTPFKPTPSIKGGTSAFYTIKVEK